MQGLTRSGSRRRQQRKIHCLLLAGADVFLIQLLVTVKTGLHPGAVVLQDHPLGVQLRQRLLLHLQAGHHQFTGLVLQQLTHRLRILTLNQPQQRTAEITELAGDGFGVIQHGRETQRRYPALNGASAAAGTAGRGT
ncbi:Uncharacterised protein [Serratia quinivorans]|nr:Uncharacterised protein [Serratia quinivorans]